MYLTTGPKNRQDAGRQASVSGVPQIEVTPEMISAGIAEIAGFDWVEDAARAPELVTRLFTAMLSASRKG